MPTKSHRNTPRPALRLFTGESRPAWPKRKTAVGERPDYFICGVYELPGQLRVTVERTLGIEEAELAMAVEQGLNHLGMENSYEEL
jgi:hypothetical protein